MYCAVDDAIYINASLSKLSLSLSPSPPSSLFLSLFLSFSYQIVTEYKDNQLQLVLDALERMHAHLTAAVVSNDLLFLQA